MQSSFDLNFASSSLIKVVLPDPLPPVRPIKYGFDMNLLFAYCFRNLQVGPNTPGHGATEVIDENLSYNQEEEENLKKPGGDLIIGDNKYQRDMDNRLWEEKEIRGPGSIFYRSSFSVVTYSAMNRQKYQINFGLLVSFR